MDQHLEAIKLIPQLDNEELLEGLLMFTTERQRLLKIGRNNTFQMCINCQYIRTISAELNNRIILN